MSLFGSDLNFKTVEEGRLTFLAIASDIIEVQYATDRRGIQRKRANCTAAIQMILAQARFCATTAKEETIKDGWNEFIDDVHDTYTKMLATKETLKFGIDRVY